MQQHGRKYFCPQTPLHDPRDGVKRSKFHFFRTMEIGSIGQNSTFSEHGHVVYQIKKNHECSSMVPNILPEDPPSNLTMRSIGQNSTILEHGHVAYQI